MFDRRSQQARGRLGAFCGAATIASGRVAAQDVVIDRESLDLPESLASSHRYLHRTRPSP